jgi:1-acyl-sn-glycerol-3-phosphate acyltransferase
MENLPESGSFIIAPNHVSFLDPPAIGVFIRRKMNYIGKQDLFKNRYFGWYMRKLRITPAGEGLLGYSCMKEIIGKIREGYPIVIFPEGTRGDGIHFLEPGPGVAYFAIKFDLPVVPAYVKGTEKALPRDARFIRMKPVRVFYGKPKRYRMPAGSDKDKAYKEVANKIMDEIKELKERYGS